MQAIKITINGKVEKEVKGTKRNGGVSAKQKKQAGRWARKELKKSVTWRDELVHLGQVNDEITETEEAAKKESQKKEISQADVILAQIESDQQNARKAVENKIRAITHEIAEIVDYINREDELGVVTPAGMALDYAGNLGRRLDEMKEKLHKMDSLMQQKRIISALDK